MSLVEKTDEYEVWENNTEKVMKSSKANFIFNKKTGVSLSWGATKIEDPIMYPSNDILDIEVTVGCKGVNGRICPWCYKANTPNNVKLMTLDEFKHIIDISPKVLSQIAFGADATLELNPDLWKMMDYCREKGIIPNITCAQINEQTADELVKRCGAVAVSCYPSIDKNTCYDSIKLLTDRGLKQVNMHFMIADETYDDALEVLNDIKTDERLKKLNAIVLLSLKTKGRGVGFHTLSQEKFNNLVKVAYEKRINLGFDSCSSYKAILAFKELGEDISSFVWDCESTLTSFYINVDSQAFPCSFTEGTDGWFEGIDLKQIHSKDEYIEKVWHNHRIEEFRNKLLSCKNEICRVCPIYEV